MYHLPCKFTFSKHVTNGKRTLPVYFKYIVSSEIRPLTQVVTKTRRICEPITERNGNIHIMSILVIYPHKTVGVVCEGNSPMYMNFKEFENIDT